MSAELTEYLESVVRARRLPEIIETTEQHESAFLHALEIADQWHGLHESLIEALDLLYTQTSKSLCCAGIAYIHTLGAYEHSFMYDISSLPTVEIWLRRAKSFGPRSTEIMFVELFVATRFRLEDKVGTLLQAMQAHAPDYQPSLMLQIDYYGIRKDIAGLQQAYVGASQNSQSQDQLAEIHRRAGNNLSSLGRKDEAMACYQKSLSIRPDNPWILHNMSIIHFDRNQLLTAFRKNRQALSLMNFDAAQYMSQKIKRKLTHTFRVIFLIGVGITVFWMSTYGAR